MLFCVYHFETKDYTTKNLTLITIHVFILVSMWTHVFARRSRTYFYWWIAILCLDCTISISKRYLTVSRSLVANYPKKLLELRNIFLIISNECNIIDIHYQHITTSRKMSMKKEWSTLHLWRSNFIGVLLNQLDQACGDCFRP